MQTLPVHLFKESFGLFVGLLNEHGVEYQLREVRTGVPMAAGGTLEIIQAVGNVAMWGSLATVLVAYINGRRGRKVIITTKAGTVIHAEGLSHKELESLLESAQNLTVVDPNKPTSEKPAM